MKKEYIIVTAVLLNLMFYSCTPQALDSGETNASPQACCGEEGTIPPPPPPPPPGGGVSTGG